MVRGARGEIRENVHSSHDKPAPALLAPRRLEQGRRARLARVGNAQQGIGAQQVDGDVEQVGEDGQAARRQQREERQQKRRLVVDAAVVGRHVVVVEE